MSTSDGLNADTSARRRKGGSPCLVLAAGLLLFAAVAGTAFLVTRPTTLRIAVGPSGSADPNCTASVPVSVLTITNTASASTTTPGSTVSLAPTSNGSALYRAPDVYLNTGAADMGASGGNGAHNNLPPYLAVTFIIALQGVFPPRS